jgi:hypothetical protein
MRDLAILLAIYSLIVTFKAIQWRIYRDAYKKANDLRAKMIEETREGKPPFLLNPGVEIVITKPL